MHSRLVDSQSQIINIFKAKTSQTLDMDAATAANNTSTFEPSSDLIQEEDCNTLLVYLPGFTKEQLKVQLTRSRIVKISGRRPLPNNRWSSFQKDFPVPEKCDTNKISAKFEEGILYVRLPTEEKKLAPAENPTPQKPAVKLPPPPPPAAKIDPPPPPPPAAKIDPPPPPQPQTRPPTPIKPPRTTDDEIKQSSGPRDSPKRPVERKEESRSGEKSGEAAEGGKKEKRRQAEEKSGGDRKAEKREKGSGSGGGAKVEADYNNLSAASPAARLKAARQQITNIAVLLFVFALGIYVSRLPWFSKRAQE